MIDEYSRGYLRSRKVLRIVLITGICILLFLLLLKVDTGIMDKIVFPVQKVQVYGNSEVSTSSIITSISLDTSSSLLFFDKKKAARALLQDQRIRKVEMVKIFPDTLRIYVAEKQKKALLRSRSGLYWVAEDVVVLGRAEENTSPQNYPLITLKSNNVDISIEKSVNNFLVPDILEAADVIKNKFPEFYSHISSFEVTDQGVYIHLENTFLNSGWKNDYRIYLGDNVRGSSLEKLRALLMVVKKEYPEKPRGRDVLEIDMSFSNAALRVRERDDGI
ncbi:MAG: cell division protein FtsQ/DivIB [Spirochaetota bacterium]